MRKSVVAALVALALLAGFAYWVGNHWRPGVPDWFGSQCRVAVDADAAAAVDAAVDTPVELDRDQLANAATITATGVRLGMPDRATVIALATALQESKLHNLPHLGSQNDHDSLGLFQQRPSQGWGSEEQIRDPRYAAERFYQALAQVDDWHRLRLTDAAQLVQRSAFPEAYQQWEDEATVLATALLGHADAAVTCRGSDQADQADQAGDRGGRGGAARADDGPAAVHRALSRDWGEQVAVTRPGDAVVQVAADKEPHGWRYAHWLVAHAHTLGVHTVHFADQSWQAATGAWAPAGTAAADVRAELHT